MNRSSKTTALAALTAGLLLGGVACALEVDRDYTFGDDPIEGAADGAAVGSDPGALGFTFDSQGDFGDGSLVDLTPFGAPVYDDSTTSRPLGGSPFGIRFDGTDDYLSGDRLGLPDTSFSSVNGDNPGPLDYAGLANRGFQLWVNPSSAGAGSAQSVVADTNQHGVRISDSDTWVLRYAGADIDSGAFVAQDAWSHVMVVRPFGPGGGARMYVDGVAVAAAPGGYDGGDNSPLVVGANTAGDGTEGTADFFSGTLDNLELFVLGTSSSDPPTVFGEFDFTQDNEFAANALASYVPGDTNGDGLVQGDGSGALGDADDVKVLVDNWRATNTINGVQLGDVNSPSVADFNFDGATDINDYLLLRENFTGANAAALDLGALLRGGVVPEPAGSAIACVALLALATRGPLSRIRTTAPLLLLALCVGALNPQAAQAADLWNVDIQGADGPTLFGQDGITLTQPDNEDGVWNGFNIDSFSENPMPAEAFQTNPSLNLVDNDGNASSVNLNFVGAYAGWNGVAGGDPLFDDYVIILPEGTLAAEDGTGGWPAPPLVFNFDGLTPNTQYGLRFYSAVNAGRPSDLLIDTNGDGVLDDETFVQLPGGSVRLPIDALSSASGVISGEVHIPEGIAESNISAIQLTIGTFALDNPVLTIDRQTGAMSLSNDTASALEIVAYDFFSDAGSFDSTSWASIADSNSDWIEVSDTTSGQNLAEVVQPAVAGETIPNDGSSLSFGTPWRQGPFEDVVAVLALADNTTVTVDVQFTGDAIERGDYDFDGDVDVADWNLFKPLFGSSTDGMGALDAYLAGDLSGDGEVGLTDVVEFSALFDAANGAGAFAQLVNSVPEPGAFVIVALTATQLIAIRRRGRNA